MDTITQGILGAVTANLGFRQKLGPGATWMAAAVAVAPDLDILVQPLLTLSGSESDPFAQFVHHRGLSHSLLLIPFYALIPAFLWYRLRKRNHRRSNGLSSDLTNTAGQSNPSAANSVPSFWLFYGCVLVALFTHPLLDWCTSYGTQLLAPLTNARFALDVLPIIDIFYSPLLILTLGLCWAVRVSAFRNEKITLVIAWIGFCLSLAYIALGAINHHRAIASLREESPDTAQAAYHAYPQVGHVFLWRVTRYDEPDWTVARVNLLFSARTSDVQHARSDQNEWGDRAKQVPQVQTFTWFAMNQIRYEYHREPHTHRVDVHDMRYGRSPASTDSLWPVRVLFDADTGEVLSVERRQEFHRGSFGETVKQLWKSLWSP